MALVRIGTGSQPSISSEIRYGIEEMFFTGREVDAQSDVVWVAFVVKRTTTFAFELQFRESVLGRCKHKQR